MRVLVVMARVRFEGVMGEERKVMVLRLLGAWFGRKVARRSRSGGASTVRCMDWDEDMCLSCA